MSNNSNKNNNYTLKNSKDFKEVWSKVLQASNEIKTNNANNVKSAQEVLKNTKEEKMVNSLKNQDEAKNFSNQSENKPSTTSIFSTNSTASGNTNISSTINATNNPLNNNATISTKVTQDDLKPEVNLTENIKKLLNQNGKIKKPASLGKGLSALLSNATTHHQASNLLHNSKENTNQDPSHQIVDIPINLIATSSYQARENFNDEKLQELSLSIKQKGVLQPILVRKFSKNINHSKLTSSTYDSTNNVISTSTQEQLTNNQNVYKVVEKNNLPNHVGSILQQKINTFNQYGNHVKKNDNSKYSLNLDTTNTLNSLSQNLQNQSIDYQYELVAGERRLRACKMAGLKTIPAIVVDLNDKEVLEVGLIENLQRENLNPIEEAKGFHRLIQEFSYTHQDIANILGVNRSYITNYLRILSLPTIVQQYIESGKLSVGHAKVIVKHDYPMELAEKIINEQLSVRDTENLSNLLKKVKNPKAMVTLLAPEDKDLVTQATTQVKKLFHNLKTQVKLNAKGGGYIKVAFKNKQDLKNLLNSNSLD